MRYSTRRGMNFDWSVRFFLTNTLASYNIICLSWCQRFGRFNWWLKNFGLLPCFLMRIHNLRLSWFRLKGWFRSWLWITKYTGVLPSLLAFFVVVRSHSWSRSIWAKNIWFIPRSLTGVNFFPFRSWGTTCVIAKQTDWSFAPWRCQNSETLYKSIKLSINFFWCVTNELNSNLNSNWPPYETGSWTKALTSRSQTLTKSKLWQSLLIEQFSVECLKTKTKVITCTTANQQPKQNAKQIHIQCS